MPAFDVGVLGCGPAGEGCTTKQGNALETDALLYCAGRQGNPDQLGLEVLWIERNRYWLLELNEHFQHRLYQGQEELVVGAQIQEPVLETAQVLGRMDDVEARVEHHGVVGLPQRFRLRA